MASEIKIINTNIIGSNPNFNQLTELFNNKYYYEYRLVNGQQIIIPTLPYTGNLFAHYKSETLMEDYNIDGRPVEQWRDSSGNDRHMVQPTSANQPTFMKFAKPLPCLGFNNSSQFLKSETTIPELSGNTPKTMFAVYTSTSCAVDAQAVCGINGTQTNTTWFQFYTYNTRDFSFIGYGTDNGNGFRSKTYNLKVAAATYNPTESQRLLCYMNKVKFTDINPTLNTGNYFFLIGRSTTSNTNPYILREHFMGFICEVLVYSEALTQQQIFDISDYLMIKYGIPSE